MRTLALLTALLLAWPAAAQLNPVPYNAANVAITGGTIIGADVSLGNATVTGGTSAQTLAAHAGAALSVTDFGAKCDGVTDDTAAFSAAGASGAAVSVPPTPAGCVISNTITFVAGTHIVGSAAKPTIRNTSLFKSRMFMAAGVVDVSIDSVTIDSNVPTSVDTGPAVLFSNCTRCYLTNSTIKNLGGASIYTGGVVLSGGTTLSAVTGNKFSVYNSMAVYVTGSTTSNNDISRNHFSGGMGAGSFGIKVDSGAYGNLLSFNKTLSNPIELIGISLGSNYNRVIGNHAEYCGDNGISIVGDHNIIKSNIAKNNSGAGVGIWGSHNIISGNIIINNNQWKVGYWGGVTIMQGYGALAQFNIITGNTLDDSQSIPTQRVGVYVGASYPAWSASLNVRAMLYYYYGSNVYLTNTTGTTGPTPPTCTSGTCSDGTITWTYIATSDPSLPMPWVGRNSVVGNSVGHAPLGDAYDVNNWMYNYWSGFDVVKRGAM